jgi:hypothetical protein
MKDRKITQVLRLSAALLLLCLVFPVNSHALVPSPSGTKVMDGVPLPPPIKGTSSQITGMLTDGILQPPPIKDTSTQIMNSILVTDGVPLPPPILKVHPPRS